MKRPSFPFDKMVQKLRDLGQKLFRGGQSILFFLRCSSCYLLAKANPFWVELCYFLSVSFIGFLLLKALKARTHSSSPRNLDLFFTSVSATAVSSMSTVEMEVFSNSQLLVLTILMFIGGEVFVSMVGLHLKKSKLKRSSAPDKVTSVNSSGYLSAVSVSNLIEEYSSTPQFNIELAVNVLETNIDLENLETSFHRPNLRREFKSSASLDLDMKYLSIKFLGFVVLGYLLVIHIVGVAMLSVYLALVSSARDLLKSKGIKLFTFSLFTIVSTFSSCGFIPTNENMMVFSKNSGLLLMLIPQALLGNTLFPSCLRFSIWVLGKLNCKKVESSYLLENTRKIGYLHLLPSLHSKLLVVTILGFIFAQFILFCSMDWNSEALTGLNSYQKVIGAIFQSVNSRHTGETIVDISKISQAILVLFVVMMYLPPYTSFLPAKGDGQKSQSYEKRRQTAIENFIFSQLSYLAIFIILICITERKKLQEDPLNFNVLNITVEVISAYGNVGFTTGYSCSRQLRPDATCVDKWFGFAGKWSDEGKIVLIIVMLFGRLKKFNMEGGKAWKLL